MTQLFRQIKGVGPITSLAFALIVEDPGRFARNRSVGAYLGLVPRQHQSGSSRPQLGITRAGDPLMRRLLVQCAHHILGRFGEDSDLRRFGQALMTRGGKNGKKRAVTAVARKLSVLLLALWKTGEVYELLRRARLLGEGRRHRGDALPRPREATLARSAERPAIPVNTCPTRPYSLLDPDPFRSDPT